MSELRHRGLPTRAELPAAPRTVSRPPRKSPVALHDPWRHVALQLSLLQLETASGLEKTRTENELLRQRLSELQTWLEQDARFGAVEQLQLGRLLARDSNEREARRVPLFASFRALLLIVYAAAALCLAVLLVAGQL